MVKANIEKDNTSLNGILFNSAPNPEITCQMIGSGINSITVPHATTSTTVTVAPYLKDAMVKATGQNIPLLYLL